MRELEGHLEELLDPHFYEKQKLDDYLKVTLLDEGALIDPINKLRQIYPNVLHLDRKVDLIDIKKKTAFSSAQREKKTDLELFEQFYEEMTTSEFTEEKRDVMTDIINRVLKEEVRR
jgi:exonuclease SbcD